MKDTSNQPGDPGPSGQPEMLPEVFLGGRGVAYGFFFDREGQPIDAMAFEYLRAYGHPDVPGGAEGYLRIGWHQVGRFEVSTVWLGVDHGFGMRAVYPEMPPVIFETMVFGHDDEDWPATGEHDYSDDVENSGRYCTVAQARAGHLEAVTVVAATTEAAPREIAAELLDGTWRIAECSRDHIQTDSGG